MSRARRRQPDHPSFAVRVTDKTGQTASSSATLVVTNPDTAASWLTDGTRRWWAPYEQTITPDNVGQIHQEYELPEPMGIQDARSNRLLRCTMDASDTLAQLVEVTSGVTVWEQSSPPVRASR